MKGFTRECALNQRPKVTRKWPIAFFAAFILAAVILHITPAFVKGDENFPVLGNLAESVFAIYLIPSASSSSSVRSLFL